MKGYLYKEFKQNRFSLLIIFVIALLMVFLPIIWIIVDEKSVEKELFISLATNGVLLRGLCTFAGFLGLLIFSSNIALKGDDSKKWGYFVASNPKGINGYIFTKYAFILFVCVIFLGLSSGLDWIFTTISRNVSDIEFPFMAKTYLIGFFVIIFLHAIEIPFSARFGDKHGSTIKMIILIIITIIIVATSIINPVLITEVVENLMEIDEIPKSLKLIMPISSVVLYFLSALLSCRVYMKGVDQYYK